MIRCASLFSQVLSLINRHQFATAVRTFRAEKAAKGFSCWDQFVAMLFCQLAQAKSLREIVQGLLCCEGKLQHLGLRAAPKRSTLSYANEHRPWKLFEAVFYQLLSQCQQAVPPRTKFRFKNKLLLLDATLIDLCVTMFDWARFRTTKGAIKLHLLLDHDGYLPVFAHITEGRQHEMKLARGLCLPRGSVVAMDRGYVDYRLFQDWTQRGISFVTRLKRGANYWAVKSLPVRKKNAICKDEIIELTPLAAGRVCKVQLRRIEVWLEDKQETLVLVTNQLTWSAATIAAIYKERWQIELFFKALKQYLKVKSFVGTSANAVHIQIWTALIAMLLVKYLQLRAKLGWALSTLIALLRWNLFTYRDLWKWIDAPFETPAGTAVAEQTWLMLDSIQLPATTTSS
jgi:transposase